MGSAGQRSSAGDPRPEGCGGVWCEGPVSESPDPDKGTSRGFAIGFPAQESPLSGSSKGAKSSPSTARFAVWSNATLRVQRETSNTLAGSSEECPGRQKPGRGRISSGSRVGKGESSPGIGLIAFGERMVGPRSWNPRLRLVRDWGTGWGGVGRVLAGREP